MMRLTRLAQLLARHMPREQRTALRSLAALLAPTRVQVGQGISLRAMLLAHGW